MRLEDYWGIGPKTSALLTTELGESRAVEAIEEIRAECLILLAPDDECRHLDSPIASRRPGEC